jgi:transposase
MSFLRLSGRRICAPDVFAQREKISVAVNAELRAEILRLHHAEKWRVNSIAAQLYVHHSTVERVLRQKAPVVCPRARKIDAFVAFIEEQLQRYPRLTAVRLFGMCRERGYTGQQSQFRAVVAELRVVSVRQAEPFQRLSTLPGEQAQVDWAHFGHLQVGHATRPLMAFVLVLSYSRAIYLRFFLSQNLSNFMYGHKHAFAHFEGCSRVCLYDNLKSVVIERIGKAIRFNRRFMELAAHYRFEPRPVGIARGSEKGRVERSIRYIRENFFAARRFKDLEDLNNQALVWCQSTALERRWPDDDRRRVGEMLQEEKSKLLPLPANEHPCAERCEVVLDKYPYARFDLNDYSVPHQYVRKTLVVVASLDTVRILDGAEVVATHVRSYDRHRLIECPEHRAQLCEWKRDSAQHRTTSVLATAVPSSGQFLAAIAARGQPTLKQACRELLELLRTYGAEALESALRETLAQNAPHLAAVRLVMERSRHDTPKPLPIQLPDDPRVQNMALAPRSLAVYDQLQEKKHDK